MKQNEQRSKISISTVINWPLKLFISAVSGFLILCSAVWLWETISPVSRFLILCSAVWLWETTSAVLCSYLWSGWEACSTNLTVLAKLNKSQESVLNLKSFEANKKLHIKHNSIIMWFRAFPRHDMIEAFKQE